MLEEYPAAQNSIVDALAVFLQRLHQIPVSHCPFNSDHLFRLALAQTRMNSGLVDADDFDDERKGWSVEQVWNEMQSLLPFSLDSVVTHGDFSLDNLIISQVKWWVVLMLVALVSPIDTRILPFSGTVSMIFHRLYRIDFFIHMASQPLI